MAGTLSTEALAVINELPRGNTDLRSNQVGDYAHQVARSHLTIYPADDDTVATNAWFRSIGGTAASPSVFTGPDSSSLSIATSGAVSTPTLSKGGQNIVIGTCSTRGIARRLLTALGITFTSPGVG